jgi:hypothetical protein
MFVYIDSHKPTGIMQYITSPAFLEFIQTYVLARPRSRSFVPEL